MAANLKSQILNFRLQMTPTLTLPRRTGRGESYTITASQGLG